MTLNDSQLSKDLRPSIVHTKYTHISSDNHKLLHLFTTRQLSFSLSLSASRKSWRETNAAISDGHTHVHLSPVGRKAHLSLVHHLVAVWVGVGGVASIHGHGGHGASAHTPLAAWRHPHAHCPGVAGGGGHARHVLGWPAVGWPPVGWSPVVLLAWAGPHL